MRREAVEITATDGCRLQGIWWRGESGWVVLAHEFGGDLDEWRPLAGWLADEGWNVLAVDARGHGGSTGRRREETIADDIGAMLRFAPERGASRVFLGIGEAARRSVCNELAEPGVAGVFAFGRVEDSDGRLRIPCLIVCGGRPARPGAARVIQERLTVAVYLPTGRGGLALLRGPWAVHVCECVSAHLRLWSGLSPPPAAPLHLGEVSADAGA
jgi:hypothetical protein